MITAKEQKDYIADGCSYCPKCQSSDIEGGFVEVDAGGAHQPVHCNQCSFRWYDVYEFKCIEEITS